LARPLVESLKHEAIVRDEGKRIIPLKLRKFEEAIDLAKGEEKIQKNSVTRKEEYVLLRVFRRRPYRQCYVFEEFQ
jgi:hypothetical protein